MRSQSTSANHSTSTLLLDPNDHQDRYLSPVGSHLSHTGSYASSGGGRDPFRDPSFDYENGQRPSIVTTALSRPTSSFEETTTSRSMPPPPPPPVRRPGLPTRESEVSRQLNDAMNDDSSEEERTPRIPQRQSSGPRPAHRPPPSSEEGRNSFLSQFRKGTGWFAPVVPPEQPLSKGDKEIADRERIKEIRSSGGKKRPSLLKRLSSGVEMLSVNSGTGNNGRRGDKIDE